MYTSANMGLRIWNLTTDLFDYTQLQGNFAAIDDHNHTLGQGLQIPTGGIANAAITGAKIATATITGAKLVPGAGYLTPASSGISATLAAGQLLTMTSGNTTATLPNSPTNGTVVGIRAGAAVNGWTGTVSSPTPAAVTVTGSQQTLIDDSIVSSFSLAKGGKAILVYSGSQSQWVCVSGTQDTGWVPINPGTNVISLDPPVASARLIGNRVWLSGTLYLQSSTLATNAAIGTLPSGFGFLPSTAINLGLTAGYSLGNPSPPTPQYTLGAAGKISTSTGTLTAQLTFPLYGLSYDLDNGE